MKTVTTEELELLKEANLKFNSLKTSLADNEISIKRLENNKTVIFSELEKISLSYKDVETNLLEKYGDISINLETGEINDKN
jgi:hypothetical protein